MIKADLMKQKPYKRSISMTYDIMSESLFNKLVLHIHSDLKKYDMYNHYLSNEHKLYYGRIFKYSLFVFILDHLLKSKVHLIVTRKNIEDYCDNKYPNFDNGHVKEIFMLSFNAIKDILPKYLILVDDEKDMTVFDLMDYKCKFINRNPVNIRKFLKFCDTVKVSSLKEKEKDIKKLIFGGY